jgi:small basic protein (TIGR04137 family)
VTLPPGTAIQPCGLGKRKGPVQVDIPCLVSKSIAPETDFHGERIDCMPGASWGPAQGVIAKAFSWFFMHSRSGESGLKNSIFTLGSGWQRFSKYPGRRTMSMHPSLKSASKIRTRRNVLKRFERVELLKKEGRWKDGDPVLGLPKTKPED